MRYRQIQQTDINNSLLNLNQLVFEVTDNCNLKCKYCGYGEFYDGYDNREAKNLPIEYAFKLIDYLSEIWSQGLTNATKQLTYISFYGGEPLMNMDFIKQCIEYIENKKLNRVIVYSMTTNAMLLDKYMDYLVMKQVRLLISLDGDKNSHSYRVNQSGENSFDRVFSNIKLLQSKYSTYFDNNVNFNSVLHNRNTVAGVHNFIKSEFGKVPTISELNNSSIRSDKIAEFEATYRNKAEDLRQSENYEQLAKDMFMNEPNTNDLLLYLHQYSGNVFRDYKSLLYNPENMSGTPSGTCTPFSKKMFVTVNGKILQCERIDHDFALGYVNSDGIHLDMALIAEKFNTWVGKIKKQCESCYRKQSCIQCVYYIDGIQQEKPMCIGFMNKEDFSKYQSYCLSHLKKNPHLYKQLLTDVLVD